MATILGPSGAIGPPQHTSGSLVVEESGFYTDWHRGNDIRLP